MKPHRQGKLGRLCLTAALGAASLVALPASAAAGPGPVPFLGGFQTKGSNGYSVSVITLGRRVWLEASSGRVSANYFVTGTVREGVIRARFGSLGRIAMRIRGEPAGSEDKGCVRERSVRAEGVFQFNGERGYTRVGRRTLRGFQVLLDVRCLARALTSAGRRRAAPEMRLTAISRVRRRVTSVDAIRRPGAASTSLFAQVEERRPRMRILRDAQVRLGGRRSLRTSAPGEGPPTATLHPPKPFAGSATMTTLGPGTSSWTGDMRVWLPGLGAVPLTGRRYAASLCMRPPGKARCPAEPPVDRPPPRPDIRLLPR